MATAASMPRILYPTQATSPAPLSPTAAKRQHQLSAMNASPSPPYSATLPTSPPGLNITDRTNADLLECLATSPSDPCQAAASSIPGLTQWEERFLFLASKMPNIGIFMFVNPHSGNRAGEALLNMDFQHFRLRSRPRVQVQWYNILDEQDRDEGLEQLRWYLGVKRKVDALLAKANVGARKIVTECDPTDANQGKCRLADDDDCQAASRTASCQTTGSADTARSMPMPVSPLPASQEALPNAFAAEQSSSKRSRTRTVRPFEVHIWSAGGDGTIMSIYDWLSNENIDFQDVLFSAVPFGTGNDFSHALGWGRTLQRSFVDNQLAGLCDLTQARLAGSLAHLDIWEVKITTYPEGHVRYIQKDRDTPKEQSFTKRFCSIFSMGVQGLVGSGFEANRSHSRTLNIMEYVRQSLKWVLFRRFPPITELLHSIERDGQVLLATESPNFVSSTYSLSTTDDGHNSVSSLASETGNHRQTVPSSPVLDAVDTTPARDESVKRRHSAIGRMESGQAPTPTHSTAHSAPTSPQSATPTLKIHPIDLIVQNIPHIWGRDHDIWNRAKLSPHTVTNRSGETLPSNWTPQMAGDGRLEMFCIENVPEYIRKQVPHMSSHLAQIGQFEDRFTLRFHHPETYLKKSPSAFHLNPLRHRVTPPGTTCLMIDGEFYELKYPMTIEFRKHNCLRAIGSDEKHSRMVRDTQFQLTHSHIYHQDSQPQSQHPPRTSVASSLTATGLSSGLARAGVLDHGAAVGPASRTQTAPPLDFESTFSYNSTPVSSTPSATNSRRTSHSSQGGESSPIDRRSFDTSAIKYLQAKVTPATKPAPKPSAKYLDIPACLRFKNSL
ncbi:hypothetical protein H4R34_003912 [Dimargaris verticillata]|uniref:DAGKc domain-containing protein n=1 Tax=Dimargaris verticillata TaxID=2761393 RepID=A0A9W8B5B5_9FUNG|nr:hypothetical protein H4R34_003912 [Dimargaris verticillata]